MLVATDHSGSTASRTHSKPPPALLTAHAPFRRTPALQQPTPAPPPTSLSRTAMPSSRSVLRLLRLPLLQLRRTLKLGRQARMARPPLEPLTTRTMAVRLPRLAKDSKVAKITTVEATKTMRLPAPVTIPRGTKDKMQIKGMQQPEEPQQEQQLAPRPRAPPCSQMVASSRTPCRRTSMCWRARSSRLWSRATD